MANLSRWTTNDYVILNNIKASKDEYESIHQPPCSILRLTAVSLGEVSLTKTYRGKSYRPADLVVTPF
jgi:hypothetical protein